MAKTKSLTISLDDRDKDNWGTNEMVYRVLMATHDIIEDDIPHIDEASSKEDRDFMFEQLLKEYKNRVEMKRQEYDEFDPIQQGTVYVVKVRTVIGVAVGVLVLIGLLIWL